MRAKNTPVRVIHWDRPAGTGYTSFDSEIGITLSFDCITMSDELYFKMEERFWIYRKGTKEQVGSWIAEQYILVKFNEGAKTAMTNSLRLVREAHEHFNDKYIETACSDGSVSSDMAAPSEENIVIMAEKIVSVAKEEGLLRATKKTQ